jgi:hypothetical protein
MSPPVFLQPSAATVSGATAQPTVPALLQPSAMAESSAALHLTVTALVEALSAPSITRERLQSLRESVTRVQTTEPPAPEAVATLHTEAPELASFWDRLTQSPEAVAAWLKVLLVIITLLIQVFGQTHTVQQNTQIVIEQCLAPQAATPPPQGRLVDHPSAQPAPPSTLR